MKWSLQMIANDENKIMEMEWFISNGLDMNNFPRPIVDLRLIEKGTVIPTTGNYADQPYITKTDDGAWLCTVTTGCRREGQCGQHIISMRSTDNGKNWSDPIYVEPPDGPVASYSVLLKIPNGRIYCFYNHNTENVEKIIADKNAYPDGYCRRVDSVGYFVFKFSDDYGRSWSDRYVIDVREMEMDRQNPYNGKIRFFWNVGKPFMHNNSAYVSIHKVGGIGHCFFNKSEGVLLRSDNLLTESDPKKITWKTLPEGEIGLRSPKGGGPISEEQSYSVMSDGTFFCVYRTVDGHPVCAYSRDSGKTWPDPEYMTYTYKGKKIKHPRAANFAWKDSNGKYLYWFHNHGGRDYNDRNPVWLCCGSEAETPEGLRIEWSQPEIVLYDDDPYVRISYPDFIESNGNYYLTETQKHTARIHKIENDFMDIIFRSRAISAIVEKGVILDVTNTGKKSTVVSMPKLPEFTIRDPVSHKEVGLDLRNGITIEMWLKLKATNQTYNIFDSRNLGGKGILITSENIGVIKILLNDGSTECSWSCDPLTIKTDKLHHVVIIIDGGPKIINFVIDGILCDGGDYRQFGWGRYSPNLKDVNGNSEVVIEKNVNGFVRSIRIYNRAIMINEAVGNYRAGLLVEKGSESV